MRKIILLYLLFVSPLISLLLSEEQGGSSLLAQVTAEARIGAVQIFVGEQTDLTVSVTCKKGSIVELPVGQRGQEIVPGIELVNMLPADTTMLDGGKSMQVTQSYIVTAWDSAFCYIPPIAVKVDGKEYQTNNLALKIYTIDVDTLHADKFFGPKTVMDAPFAWEDWKMVVVCSMLFLLLFLCIGVLAISLHTGKPIIRIIRRKRKQPAHKVALSEIERIKTERTWAQEDSKEYYTQLTDTLRNYIQERYGFNAMEMTSGEIIDRLTEENDEEALAELRELFQTADLVKFAKWTTLINENDANLMTALEYINQTKQEEDPNQPQEEVIVTPEARRQRATIWSMRVTIIVGSIVAACMLGWIIYRMIDLLH